MRKILYELKDKYKSVLSDVSAWHAPSDDYYEFKEFMMEQIQKSIEFDCGTSYYENNDIVEQSAREWASAQMAALTKSIAYHHEQQAKEEKTVAGRNKWVRALRESLGE